MEGLKIDQVPKSLGDPASEPRVVGQVEVPQRVKIAEALRHFSLGASPCLVGAWCIRGSTVDEVGQRTVRFIYLVLQ